MTKLRTLSKRQAVAWLARLALFALLFQVSAFDHHTHPHISGAPGDHHATHCHGIVDTCANGGGADGTALLTTPSLLPAASNSGIALAVATDADAPNEAELTIGTEPPRA